MWVGQLTDVGAPTYAPARRWMQPPHLCRARSTLLRLVLLMLAGRRAGHGHGSHAFEPGIWGRGGRRQAVVLVAVPCFSAARYQVAYRSSSLSPAVASDAGGVAAGQCPRSRGWRSFAPVGSPCPVTGACCWKVLRAAPPEAGAQAGHARPLLLHVQACDLSRINACWRRSLRPRLQGGGPDVGDVTAATRCATMEPRTATSRPRPCRPV